MNSPSLRLRCRDPRVIRGFALASRGLGAGSLAFVSAILGRRRRTIATVFGPDRTSRRWQGLTITTHHHHPAGRHTAFAIRCEIAVTPATRARSRPAPFLPWATASATATPPAPLIERIIARERRVESSATVHDVLRDAVTPERAIPSLPPPITRPRTPPVAMIVRTPRVPSSATPHGAPPEPPRPEPEERFMRPSVARTGAMQVQVPLSATELGRVTDHVVRAIDRRILVQRERRGRI